MSEKKKLTRAERKQIEAAIARANRTDKKEKSAQDSIPYQRMWPDGICRVTNTRYTKTIQYQDINYQLSQNEDKAAIFEAWCDFLNYFDSSVQFQLSFVNLSASQETFARSISIPPCGDEFDGIRAEYAGMLQNQLARGNNGLIKTKYLTFGVEADNLRAAKPRLERIETDLLNNFKRLGVVAAPLNGFERLHVMHDILRMDEQEPFRFSWDWLAPSGLSTKDFIAPSSFEFKTGRQFRMGKKLGAVSFVQILAPELNDRMLADFLDMESSVLVNLHVQSVDQVNAIKTVKRKITDLDKSKIEEQKKAVRAGYDIDNGATGTNFHRPGFQQMLSDIEAGHVNCVIVKDLSRLGRNTIDTGYYIEQYFRIRSIRFIAVNENFDTAAPEDAHSGIIIPLRNMINEAYALDIGRKIRAQQRQAMKDGKFIGARTPYGYLKAEDDCHQLIIDPVAAVVVQRMFRWASEGAGLNTIAVRLNEAGVLTPSHYKKMQGKITHANLLGNGKWQTRTVGVILRSEVYTGDLVQGQTKTVDHRQVKADAEEWTVVRDTHEAIISREQFAAVQEILNQTASRAKAREVKVYTPNLFKGKVFCAHCGGSLHRQRNIRKKSDDVYLYHCLSRSRISKDACPGVTIREDMLLDMLADMLQDALDTALGQYTLSLAELPRQVDDRAELREKITSRKQEIQRLRGIVRSLYENLVQGVLTKDEYFDYKEKYESRIADLAVEMEQLEDGLRTMDAQTEQHRALEQDAAQIKTDRALTGALIERLIDRIEVSHDKQITVRYRFQSEFETYAEVLEQCRNM